MPRRLTLRDLPASERPRERLFAMGAEGLSDSELLAILCRTGNRSETALQLAQRLLVAGQAMGDGPLVFLREAPAAELAAIPGIGTVRAAQIKAALELGRRCHGLREQGPVIASPQDAAALLLPLMQHLDREHFRVVMLNSQNRVLGIELVSIGGLRECMAHPREVFKAPIRRSANAVILAHNHPSGDPTPSPEDEALTRRLVQAGHLLGIEVLDHLVIGAAQCVSLRERSADWPLLAAGA